MSAEPCNILDRLQPLCDPDEDKSKTMDGWNF